MKICGIMFTIINCFYLFTTSHTHMRILLFIYFCYDMFLYTMMYLWGLECNKEFIVERHSSDLESAWSNGIKTTRKHYICYKTRFSDKIHYTSLGYGSSFNYSHRLHLYTIIAEMNQELCFLFLKCYCFSCVSSWLSMD